MTTAPARSTPDADRFSWPFVLHWTWTAQVFFTLHLLVLLMKMHSYAFYNGHLSVTERRLSALDDSKSSLTTAAVRYPKSKSPQSELEALAAKKHGEADQISLSQVREDLALELISPLGHTTYPQNLTIANYVDYVFCPTLCYELEYPRTNGRQWSELFYKTLATFGCIFLLVLTSEQFIIPVLNEAEVRLQDARAISDMAWILAESISLLLFPFMVTLLLVFLVIWEYILGAFAEITCFADRHFYSDWWNSCDWYRPLCHYACRTDTDQETGSSSPANGTFLSIISCVAMSTQHLDHTYPATWQPSSPFSLALLGMNS